MALHPHLTDAEQLAKAQEPARVANDLHRFYQGKVETALRCRVRDFNDFAIWYTPGVAEPCKAIAADPDLVYDYTHKGNTVAIVSDGTRVLGLGDIGPKAGLPVMEGKALLYKYLGGVDAWPIMVDTHDPNVLIETVLRITPGFGGINLEDIAQPKCFRVLDELRNRAEVPIWHDDQQGTATVVLAGLINALKLVGKRPADVVVAFIGSGASNVACARLAFASGINPAQCRIVDSKGILHTSRTDIYQHRDAFRDKWLLCQTTNAEGVTGSIAEALRGADVVIALSRPGPGVIKPEWIRTMTQDPIVFACANPTPEIWPWEAREAGAAVVATGRSDFPNQINNSLVFPGIFRGALDVRARTVTDEMCLAAAHALADMASEHGLDPEYIVPNMDEWHVFPREAAAVAVEATRQNVARKPTTYDEEYARAEAIIARSRSMTRRAMEEGFIPAAD
jgi:malate dehydrogenase (oxaloacetate-decarboxylating)